MTRVKVCGITCLEDALAAVEAGAYALGFVFADSPRRVSPASARGIVDRLPPFVVTVGVFVDEPLAALRRVLAESGVRVAQLHGHESPDYCANLPCPVIKRMDVGSPRNVVRLAESLELYNVSSVLLDPGCGQGRPADWSLLRDAVSRRIPDRLGQPYVILAGGLTASNVGEAIRLVRPDALDVCSGVESCPGRKDPAKLKAFIRAVEEADAVLAT